MTAHDDYYAYIQSLGPIAYWTFQGLAPGALHDTTGNGHDLTGHGGFSLANTFPLDGFQAALLDGTTAYFGIASAAGLKSSPFSAIAMCQPTACNGVVFSYENAVSPVQTGIGYGIADSTNHCGPFARVGSASNNVSAVGPSSFGAYGSVPIQLGITFDGITLACYVNGNVVASGVQTAYSAGTQTPTIGCYPSTTSGFFKGLLSDLAIFNISVPVNDIAQGAVTGGLQAPLSAPQVVGLLDDILNAVRKTFPTT